MYKDLLRSIYERVWGDSQHPSAKDFEKEDYIQVLEEIAVSLWHRESRSASVTEMSARLEKTGLQEKFSQFKEGAEKPISRLLTAFYFRQRDEMRDGEERFEFTHKSFGEYLTARNIVRQVSNLFKMWDLNQEDSSLGWNSVDCLKKWVELSGSTALDWALYRFLGNEITQKDQNSLEKWQGMFCQLIGYMLRNGMPMEQCQLENYHEMSRQARNAEEGLLVVLSLCARETKKLSQIGWPSNTSFGEWLSRLVEQRKIKLLCLEALICLDLSLAFLYNANLRDANLVDANLSSAILISAILISANLISAKLMEADLSYANLSSANLISANLSDADLSDADLSSAILISADLSSANLSSANLSDAYLSDAYLSDANLFQTDIEGADFTDAKNLETVKNLHLARDLEKAVGIPEDLMKELMRKREAGVLDV
ncbi:MAG: pentapeptide repeat-containing protein [Spirochaetota bacterium]|nr:pentapeptide repeat-containing protein [Spirochaetota bacterium]